MYRIWQKWSTAFTKDFFTVEFKSSSRSESTNHVLNGIANKSISLTKFVIEYENVLGGMRSSELDEDFRCKQSAPQKAVKKSGIFALVRYSIYLKINFLIVLQWFEIKLIAKVQLVFLRSKKKIVKEYALSGLIISIVIFLVLVRNLSHWGFFVVMHCGFLV